MMSSGIAEKPLSFYARVAGFSILLVGAAGIFANIFVMGGLVATDDAAATINNISANDLLFRFGILGFAVVYLLDLIVAWALYVLLKQVNKNIALLALLFRTVHVTVSSAAIFNFLSISRLVNNAGRLDANQVGLELTAFIDAISDAWSIGLLFFGVHLLLLGYLMFKSGFIPKLFGILILLSGLCYFIDNIGWILLSDYTGVMEVFSLIVFALAVIAELAFAIWLLVKGKKALDRMS